MSFVYCWEMIGKNSASSLWQTGTATTRGEEYFRRKEVKHNGGHNLIQQLPEQLRPLAFERFGMRSSALTITNFLPFSGFLKNDPVYGEQLNEFMNCNTDHSSSNESSNKLNQWQEVMPPADQKNITVGPLKKYLLTADMSEQQQH